MLSARESTPGVSLRNTVRARERMLNGSTDARRDRNCARAMELEPAADALPPLPPLPPRMGSGAELSSLGRTVQKAAQERGGRMVLTGGPGIGKSRLLEEVAARVEPVSPELATHLLAVRNALATGDQQGIPTGDTTCCRPERAYGEVARSHMSGRGHGGRHRGVQPPRSDSWMVRCLEGDGPRGPDDRRQPKNRRAYPGHG
jgi:hypothetical protein